MTDLTYKIRIKIGDIEIEVDGDKEFVVQQIKEFSTEIPNFGKEFSSQKGTIVTKTPNEKSKLEGISLAEFYKQKKPKEDIDVALTIAYYLTSSEEREKFTNKEIKDETDKLGYKLSNPAVTLKEAAKGKKAYVRKIGTGKWALTTEGRRFVEEELPRKEKES